MTEHAQLSASSSHRWLHCTPSGNLAKHFKLPPESGSPYAQEGTDAHTLAEIKLQYALGKIKKNTMTIRSKKLRETSEFHSLDFERHVDEYVNQVLELAKEYDKPAVDVEQRLDFSQWVPNGFGTADAVILAEPTLHIIDLKFGKGVAVSADQNSQLMLYALAAYYTYNLVYDFETVKMTIIQPRLYNTSTYELPVRDLLDWADNYVKPRAMLAIDGGGEFDPQGDVCRFCPAKAMCKARAEYNTSFNTTDPGALTNDEIAAMLHLVKDIEAWCKDLAGYALTQARDHGVKFEGWKLVEGRSLRKITDPDKVSTVLAEQGYSEDDYAPRKLLSLTELEKLVGKVKLTQTLGDIIVKPAGAPTLVPADDKRPEIGQMEAADFE
jgi:hypothetical protein